MGMFSSVQVMILERQFQVQRALAEQAIKQVSEEQVIALLNPTQLESNSIRILQKHIAWTLYFRAATISGKEIQPFCTRDESLVLLPHDDAARIWQEWGDAWSLINRTLQGLSISRLAEEVDVRGKNVGVHEVALMLLTHVSQHVGQIIMLAKHWAGESWVPLTVAKTKTA